MDNIEELLKCTKNLTLLYVEDNQENRISALSFLENLFTNIIIGIDGLDGLEKFNNNKIDIIITDINMPKMDGLEMSKNIKNINSNIPILLLSAYNEKGFCEIANNIGVDGYLYKPVQMDQFLQELHMCIKKLNQ
ncbi:MAG: response regulator [Arcobacteraceae bacterium]|nr:response regulator [Arcobacteraceae bacterium]